MDGVIHTDQDMHLDRNMQAYRQRLKGTDRGRYTDRDRQTDICIRVDRQNTQAAREKNIITSKHMLKA